LFQGRRWLGSHPVVVVPPPPPQAALTQINQMPKPGELAPLCVAES